MSLTLSIDNITLTFEPFDLENIPEESVEGQPGILLLRDRAHDDFCVAATNDILDWHRYFINGRVGDVLYKRYGKFAHLHCDIHYIARPLAWEESPELTFNYGSVKKTVERMLVGNLANKTREANLKEWQRRYAHATPTEGKK